MRLQGPRRPGHSGRSSGGLHTSGTPRTRVGIDEAPSFSLMLARCTSTVFTDRQVRRNDLAPLPLDQTVQHFLLARRERVDPLTQFELAHVFRVTLGREFHCALNALEHLLRVVRLLDEVGSHSVMFVKTTQIRVRADGDSLIYFDRNFHRVPRAWKGQ
ncbi:hypothetical protein OKW37_004692 [Paraburkholderia sp. MM5482-R2]